MEYQVVRLFEDLLSAWPFIAEPVPDDVASRFFGWYSRAAHDQVTREGDDATQEAWDEACFWWRERNVQFNHLRCAPELYFWRAGSVVNLVWDAPGENEAGPVWSVQHARLALPLEDVREAIGSFCRDFLETMARRVAGIEHGGWKRMDCALDVAQLAAEQNEWQTWPAAMLGRTAVTDWALVRRRLDELGAW